MIETDVGKLKTVVRNLVHNALKFTERGSVTLGARLTADGEVAITVADTGCGIPSDALGYVFEMFRQVPGTQGGGVGLGLHIVRRFADALGASVRVESEAGEGTCFTVTLPRTGALVPAADVRPRADAA
jgi:signal transduction histidine kinase